MNVRKIIAMMGALITGGIGIVSTAEHSQLKLLCHLTNSLFGMLLDVRKTGYY